MLVIRFSGLQKYHDISAQGGVRSFVEFLSFDMLRWINTISAID